jgi:hypothetical protein
MTSVRVRISGVNLIFINILYRYPLSGSLRPFEEEPTSFKKSHSYDPFPVLDHNHHQLNKRSNEHFRKRKCANASEPLKEVGCNGGVTSSSQIPRFPRSDHEPLLESKRWHSLELETVRTNRDEEESSGCEERNGTSKKSLGRIKSWLVGILKSKNPNGQNELLSQQTSITKNKTVDNNESMSVV